MADGQDWWRSVQTFLTQFDQQPQQPRVPRVMRPAPDQEPNTNNIGGLIIQSAETQRLLMMLYNSNWRYIEPYSYRAFSTGMHLMAFCHRHQHIEMFKPVKMEAVILTDIAFKPKWPIEVGKG